ncbi:ubiquitin thioesterase otulin [Callorhinchus milii]|uniref:ubiquitin thioesterase otulin n=1 Tax=Callorhinchus milii TaxID=7868 RepID=UPI001C3FAB0C|nr:ubiquitin thioesterase otulin [Callorhinchus milii]
MELSVEILRWMCGGIQAICWTIDHLLYCFIIMSVIGLIMHCICKDPSLPENILISKEGKGDNITGEQTIEANEDSFGITKTEDLRKLIENQANKHIVTSLVDPLHQSNGKKRLTALIEHSKDEDFPWSDILYVDNPAEEFDIYTSMSEGDQGDLRWRDTDNTKQHGSDEEDLYRSVDDIKQSQLMLSFAPKCDLILHNESKEETDKVEAVSTEWSILNSENMKKDNYFQLRKVTCEALIRGKSLPSWIVTEEMSQIPRRLSQEGYAWINQWCFEHKIGGNPVQKLQSCLETLEKKWLAICCIHSETERAEACGNLLKDETTEQRMYEAVKFLMLYKAIHLYNDMENGRKVPEFCKHLFARNTSFSPYHLMVNHLNWIGYSSGLEETEMELLRHTLETTISGYFVDCPDH